MKDVKSIPLVSTEYWNRAGDRHGLHGLVTTARRSRHTSKNNTKQQQEQPKIKRKEKKKFKKSKEKNKKQEPS